MQADEWLDAHPEDALEPDLEIFDPHHHLWDFPDGTYLQGDLLEDLSGGHRVTGTVFVECGAEYRTE